MAIAMCVLALGGLAQGQQALNKPPVVALGSIASQPDPAPEYGMTGVKVVPLGSIAPKEEPNEALRLTREKAAREHRYVGDMGASSSPAVVSYGSNKTNEMIKNYIGQDYPEKNDGTIGGEPAYFMYGSNAAYDPSMRSIDALQRANYFARPSIVTHW
jgi:hypothetical protein